MSTHVRSSIKHIRLIVTNTNPISNSEQTIAESPHKNGQQPMPSMGLNIFNWPNIRP